MSLLILADSLYFCLSVRQTINSMRKIFLAVATALAMFSCSQKEPVTVTITNPLSIDRNGEMVEISMAEITGKLQLPDTGNFSSEFPLLLQQAFCHREHGMQSSEFSGL